MTLASVASADPGRGSDRAAAVAAAVDAATGAADEVDRDARFPAEAVAAMRAGGLLGMAVDGATLREVAAVARALGGGCSSAGMVFAMHQIQVWCLLRHGGAGLAATLADVGARQLLLASATTETGVGGDTRTSLAAVETDGSTASLAKSTPVVSYGVHADAVLATARRGPDSPPSDQVLVYCPADEVHLEPTSTWDPLGFRGTCSAGFELRWQGPADRVLPDPYAEIAAATMLPVSHVLWSSLWLGMAEAAVARAHRFVRGAARAQVGATPPAATRLADVVVRLETMRGLVERGLDRWEALHATPADELRPADTVFWNALKVGASELLVEVVSACLRVCGMAGYQRQSPYSIGRLLRDAHGAALMISNDRVLAGTAGLLLATREL